MCWRAYPVDDLVRVRRREAPTVGSATTLTSRAWRRYGSDQLELACSQDRTDVLRLPLHRSEAVRLRREGDADRSGARAQPLLEVRYQRVAGGVAQRFHVDGRRKGRELATQQLGRGWEADGAGVDVDRTPLKPVRSASVRRASASPYENGARMRSAISGPA